MCRQLAARRPASSGRSPVDRADELLRALPKVRQLGEPALDELVEGILRWFADGGDLPKHLGLRAGRGKRNEAPHSGQRRRLLEHAMRQVAATLPGDVGEQADALRLMIRAGDERTRVFHQYGQAPESRKRILLILRAPAGR